MGMCQTAICHLRTTDRCWRGQSAVTHLSVLDSSDSGIVTEQVDSGPPFFCQPDCLIDAIMNLCRLGAFHEFSSCIVNQVYAKSLARRYIR